MFLLRKASQFLQRLLASPKFLLFLPALSLAAYWARGESGLVAVAVGGPALFLLFARGINGAGYTAAETDALTGLVLCPTLVEHLDQAIESAADSGRATACLSVSIDEFGDLVDRLGRASAEDVQRQVAARIRSVLRQGDCLARLDGSRFGIGLAPVHRADLETLIQIATRVQAAISDPISIDAASIYVTGSVGFCLMSRSPANTGIALLDSADHALVEAVQNGPGSIRAYSSEMRKTAMTRTALRSEVADALETGQIRPWFQPQISTDTGRVTGFEALARWVHPVNGIVAPDAFLPTIEEAGLSPRLGEIILYNALTALVSFDAAGLDVPTIGVNFSSAELRNPKLVDKIRWELDRFDLSPKRLCVEILETVVAAREDDIITRNIKGLSELGCLIDLDDFGTGHASISSIRRFAVRRIKIDRSFVTKVDEDQQQQRMVSAILTMAEQLQLDTLAEGVETIGEHAMLSQLGCGHVQGFGLAHPMPVETVPEWLSKHNAKLATPPKIGRSIG